MGSSGEWPTLCESGFATRRTGCLRRAGRLPRPLARSGRLPFRVAAETHAADSGATPGDDHLPADFQGSRGRPAAPEVPECLPGFRCRFGSLTPDEPAGAVWSDGVQKAKHTLGWDGAASGWLAPGTCREDRAPSRPPQASCGRRCLDRRVRPGLELDRVRGRC